MAKAVCASCGCMCDTRQVHACNVCGACVCDSCFSQGGGMCQGCQSEDERYIPD